MQETRGPRAFYRSPDNQQQTLQSDKKTTRMTGFKLMHVLSAIHQYVAVNIWSEGGFRQRRNPSSAYFCPVLDPPLGISGRHHYHNGSIPSKALCLWSSLWILLALPWIHPRADLITRGPRRATVAHLSTINASKIWLRNGTKNNNTSSYMFQDHCYAFCLLLYPSGLKKFLKCATFFDGLARMAIFIHFLAPDKHKLGRGS